MAVCYQTWQQGFLILLSKSETAGVSLDFNFRLCKILAKTSMPLHFFFFYDVVSKRRIDSYARSHNKLSTKDFIQVFS